MTDEADNIKAVVARGKQRYFERHTQLLKELEADVRRAAGAGGADIAQRLEVAKYRAIVAAAKTMKKDSLLMLLELGADSAEELEELIAAQNRQIKKTIGL